MTLCVFGTAVGVLIQGVDFGMTCTLGIISLMGIIVHNGIIMIDYAKKLGLRRNSVCVMPFIILPANVIHLPDLGRCLHGSHPDDIGQERTLDADGYGDLLRYADYHALPLDGASGGLPADFQRKQSETCPTGSVKA